MNIFDKLNNDEWHNLVVLCNGQYFWTQEIICEYERNGLNWIEFSLANTGDSKFHVLSKEKFNYTFRRICIRADQILFIAEVDS